MPSGVLSCLERSMGETRVSSPELNRTTPQPLIGIFRLLPRHGSRLGSAQRHFLAGAAGAVHGVHKFESLVSFFARDQRLAPCADGLPEIAELTLKWLDRNRHWIG